MTESKRESKPAKISLPSMVQYLRDSENLIDIHFDFPSKKVRDMKNSRAIGDFNKIGHGANSGKVFISPLALVTIRTRLELGEYGSVTDKMVRDALVMCYDDMQAAYKPLAALYAPSTTLPWFTGEAP